MFVKWMIFLKYRAFLKNTICSVQRIKNTLHIDKMLDLWYNGNKVTQRRVRKWIAPLAGRRMDVPCGASRTVHPVVLRGGFAPSAPFVCKRVTARYRGAVKSFRATAE